MRILFLSFILTLGFSLPAQAQYSPGGKLYSSDGQYLGNVNNNQYDPNSINNPYGKYGSKYSPNSINNQFGKYGNKYSPNYVPNPTRKRNEKGFSY